MLNCGLVMSYSVYDIDKSGKRSCIDPRCGSACYPECLNRPEEFEACCKGIEKLWVESNIL